jgi:tetratricopeptide (TPR) repeat protein
MTINKAISINPNNEVDWLNKGNALRDQGKYVEAIQAYDEAIRLDPEFALAWSNKGISLGKQGKYDEAIKAFDEAIRLDPNLAQPWYYKGAVSRHLGDLRKLMQLSPRPRSWGIRAES